MFATMSRSNRSSLALAFLLVSAGIGCCLYAGLLWRDLPRYTEAEIRTSADLNLAIDLAREHLDAEKLAPEVLDARRARTVAEVKADIADDAKVPRIWLLVGLILTAFGAIRGWMARRAP